MDGQGVLNRGAAPAEAAPEPKSLVKVLLKNAFALFVVGGFFYGLETGYLSNDRTSRTESNEMDRLKAGKGATVYEAVFDRDLINVRLPEGVWDFYNGASSDTVSFADGVLDVRYSSSWVGVQFRHLKSEPSRHYRVRLEAKVEEQAGAILMRNRQLDLMREEIPLSNGEFKEFTFHYTAPGGSLDQVNVIFMPNEPEQVKGRMTIRRFRIEMLGG